MYGLRKVKLKIKWPGRLEKTNLVENLKEINYRLHTYISATVYFSNYIYTNLIHVTTKTTRSIMATVLEQALTAI